MGLAEEEKKKEEQDKLIQEYKHDLEVAEYERELYRAGVVTEHDKNKELNTTVELEAEKCEDCTGKKETGTKKGPRNNEPDEEKSQVDDKDNKEESIEIKDQRNRDLKKRNKRLKEEIKKMKKKKQKKVRS